MTEPDCREAQALSPDADGANAEPLSQEVRSLRQALEQSDAERREVLSSTSWRVTAPLRAIRRLISGERRRPVTKIGIQHEIPAQLRRSTQTDAEFSNDTYSLIDATSATEALRSAPRKPATSYRVAFLGSCELEEDLGHDAEVERIAELGWHSQLKADCFDFLLLEPVWIASGGDWRYACSRGGARSGELKLLLKHCRTIGLPTVLWFREDPSNYEDFAWLSELVDLAYGVSQEVAERIAQDFPQSSAGKLPPAVQPAIDNPLRTYALAETAPWFSDRVLFDGWWELVRQQSTRDVISSLKDRDLLVCESAWDFGGVRLGDLADFSSSVVGCVDRQGKAAINKLIAAEVFTSDRFRLPWQRKQAMMRAIACGSLVGSLASPSDEVCELPGAWHGSEAGLLPWLDEIKSNPLSAMMLSHRARRDLLNSHTVAHRLNQIADDLGLHRRTDSRSAKVAMILVTMRPDMLAQCLDRYRRDTYSNKELVVVIHGDYDLAHARKMIRAEEQIRLMQVGGERSLGACLNRAIDATDADFWAKVDDDDIYGPNYLTDLMLGRQFVDYSIAGKPPMFAYREKSDSLYFDPVWGAKANLWHDPEEASAALVAGGTLVGKRQLLDDVRFCERRRGGSDSDFIRRCYESGYGLAALDGFNFVRYRSATEGFHTWAMDESDLLDRAKRVGGRSNIESFAFV